MGNSKKSASYFKLQRKHTVDFEVFKKVLGYPTPPPNSASGPVAPAPSPLTPSPCAHCQPWSLCRLRCLPIPPSTLQVTICGFSYTGMVSK